MKHNSRITPRQPFDDGRDEDFGDIGAASDPHFPGAWVGEKLDVLHALLQLVEGRAPCLSMARPYSVGSIPCVLRSRRRTPMICSSSAIDLEMAGWEVFRSAAAFFILPACATVIRMWMCCSFIRRPM